VNCNETLLAGVWSDPREAEILRRYPTKSGFFNRIYEAHIPHVLFTLNLQTKQIQKIDSEDTWLNHEQFSPTDPDLLLYAHEGPWDQVDRTWLINVKQKKKFCCTNDRFLMKSTAMNGGHPMENRCGLICKYPDL